MNAPYYADESVTLWHGDAAAVLADLPAASVDCCVTSPPYFGLRDYGVAGQLGLEASPAEYVVGMVAVLEQVRRVLANDGTLWLNLGDSYVGSGKPGGVSVTLVGTSQQITSAGEIRPKPGIPKNLLGIPKNLLGIPWRVAFALQDAGWILRNAIVWHKPNGMPTSVLDRFATKYELVFMLSKSPRYWFDIDAVRVPHAEATLVRYQTPTRPKSHPSARTGVGRDGIEAGHAPTVGVNPGDMWTITTEPTDFAHFATMPTALAERCIQAGCKPGGTVLDPFSGSGTTGLAAAKHGRRYVGIDLNAEYLDLSLRTRLAQTALLDGELA